MTGATGFVGGRLVPESLGAVVLVLAAAYDLPGAALAGAAAVVVATAGSAATVAIGTTLRESDVDRGYRRIPFDSNVDVVLGVLAYAALSTSLVVGSSGVDPGFLERVLARTARSGCLRRLRARVGRLLPHRRGPASSTAGAR